MSKKFQKPDNARMPAEFVDCLEEAGPGSPQACDWPRERALRPDPQVDAVALVDRASLIDLSDLYCDADVCAPVIGGVVSYRPDGHHLTATFVETMAPRLGAELEEALGRG